MLMIEPTPYILGFIREVKNVWHGEVEVAYTGQNVTQAWDESVASDLVLDGSFFSEILRLWHQLSHDRYAMVHLAGWSHPLIVVALMICTVRRIPVSVESDTSRQVETALWRRWLKQMIYPLLFRLPRRFLPGGTRQAQYLQDYGVPSKKITIAQMTVDVDALISYYTGIDSERRVDVRQKYGIPKDSVALLFVGRLEPYKGIGDLLQAYLELRKSGEDCALLVVGEGTCRREIDDMALHVDGIVSTGRLSGSDLFDAYIAADVFVLPSLLEPWGLVVNEAMAFGLPVVVTDIVGCADDLVIPGVTGFVVPASQPEELVGAVRKLVIDAELRRSCVKASIEHIRPWTLRNEALRVARAWNEMLDERVTSLEKNL